MINLHSKSSSSSSSSASSSLKFCSSRMLVEILWISKETTFSHKCQCFHGNSLSALFQTPDRFTAPQSLFCRDDQHVSDGLSHLPKALNRETISCRLSWNGGRWMLDAGRASICRPENKIFSAVPNPRVCPERDQNRAINHSGIKQTKF